MKSDLRIFVPRWMDAANTNAQNLNARALLSRFTGSRARWVATHFNEPDPAVALPHIELQRLWRTRLWRTHTVMLYQQHADGIFYPGIEGFDDAGLRIRRACGRRIPVIGTLEGLVGDAVRQDMLASVVDHEVHCFQAPRKAMERIDRVLRACDHVVAITPMLAKIGQALYGDKFSMIPLGIDGDVFRPRPCSGNRTRPRVMTVATLTERKRPKVMLAIARRLPDFDFVWYGSGPLLEPLRAAAMAENIRNIAFPGVRSPEQLADAYAKADLFVLPSFSEGAPKALQEAAACGLPRIAFGFYEPQIAEGEDGYVVWSDEEFLDRIEKVGNNLEKYRALKERPATDLRWDSVAPLWEEAIISRIASLS